MPTPYIEDPNIEEFLWPATTHGMAAAFPANLILPYQPKPQDIKSIALRYLDNILKKAYATCTAPEKQTIIKKILKDLKNGVTIFNAFPASYYKNLFKLFSLIKNDMRAEEFRAFISNITSKPIPTSDQAFCLEHFGPYYDHEQLYAAVAEYLSFMKRTGIVSLPVLALKNILPDLTYNQKYEVLDYLIEELYKAFLDFNNYKVATHIAIVLCQSLKYINTEYRETIIARFAWLIGAHLEHTDYREIFLELLKNRDPLLRSFRLAIITYLVKALYLNFNDHPTDKNKKLVLMFLDLIPSFGPEEQKIVTRYFRLELANPDITRRFQYDLLTQVLKCLRDYFTPQERSTLRITFERYALESTSAIVRLEAVKLLGYYIRILPLKEQNSTMMSLVRYVNQHKLKKETFCEGLVGCIDSQSDYYSFFIHELLSYKPELLQRHLGFENGEVLDTRTILERSAWLFQLPLLTRFALTQSVSPLVREYLKFMYFYVKSKTVRDFLSPVSSEMSLGQPIFRENVLDQVDSFLHGSAYKNPYGVTFFQQTKPSGVVIEPMETLTI